MTCIGEVLITLHASIATSLLIILTRPYRKAVIQTLIQIGLRTLKDEEIQRKTITVRRNLTPVVPINSISKVG